MLDWKREEANRSLKRNPLALARRAERSGSMPCPRAVTAPHPAMKLESGGAIEGQLSGSERAPFAGNDSRDHQHRAKALELADVNIQGLVEGRRAMEPEIG